MKIEMGAMPGLSFTRVRKRLVIRRVLLGSVVPTFMRVMRSLKVPMGPLTRLSTVSLLAEVAMQ